MSRNFLMGRDYNDNLDIHAGLFEYDAEIMRNVVEACWDAIKR